METPDTDVNPVDNVAEDSDTETGVQPDPETFKFEDRELSVTDAKNTVIWHELQEKEMPAGLKDFSEGKKPAEVPVEPDVAKTGDTDPIIEDDAKPVEPTTETEEPKSEHSLEELAKSRTALKRYNWPDDLIDQLSPEEIISRGTEAAERQSLADREYSQKKQLEATLAEYGVKKPEQEEEPEVVDAAKDLFETLAEDEIHSDLADPLKAALAQQQATLDRQVAEMSYQAEANKYELDSLRRANEDMLLEKTRMSFAKDEWPQLADSAKFDEVKQKVYELSGLPGYHDENSSPNVELLMDHACLMILGADKKQQQQRKMLGEYERQTRGQPEDSTDNPPATDKPTSAMSKDEKNALIMTLLQTAGADGKYPTPDQVREQVNKIPDR
jgi:hypothetical protein